MTFAKPYTSKYIFMYNYFSCKHKIIRSWGMSSSLVRASEFKSEDPVFNPLAGQGESTPVQTCLCLTPLCACLFYLNCHISTVTLVNTNRVGLTAGGELITNVGG